MTIPMYGVWIKSLGWLRSNGKAFATDNKAIAVETAKRVNGEVFFIDESLVGLEREFLEMETSKVEGIRELFASWVRHIKVGGN
jgi:hypothetical protein